MDNAFGGPAAPKIGVVDDLLDSDWYLRRTPSPTGPRGHVPLAAGPAGQWAAWWRWQAGNADHRAEQLATTQGFVVSTRDLDRLGCTRAQVRTRVARGDWWIPRRGFVATVPVDEAADQWDAKRCRHALACSAAAIANCDDAICGRSAAVLHGLPTYRHPDEPTLTLRAPARLGRRSAVHSRGATLAPRDLTQWFGVPVTTVARTLVDLARHDRRDGIAATDAALRESLVTASAITAALEVATGWPGVRQAREVLALADPRVESVLESIVRLALHDDGFPPPEPQFWIGGHRVDFCWPAYRFVLEADGRGKYSDDALWEEKERERALRRHGFRVERVVWTDATRTWPATSIWLRAQLFA